jgi:hypothetical protein
MKATINENGTLIVMAENEIESFAMNEWVNKNTNPCDGQFICKYYYDALQLCPYREKHITLFHRIWIKVQLFLYR